MVRGVEVLPSKLSAAAFSNPKLASQGKIDSDGPGPIQDIASGVSEAEGSVGYDREGRQIEPRVGGRIRYSAGRNPVGTSSLSQVVRWTGQLRGEGLPAVHGSTPGKLPSARQEVLIERKP